MCPVLECPGLSLQSSRSLDTLTDLKVQCLEAELEGVWHEARGAFQREAELKAELQRLQEEIRQEKERQVHKHTRARAHTHICTNTHFYTHSHMQKRTHRHTHFLTY